MKNIFISVFLVLSVLTFSSGCADKALDASRAGTISESYAGVVLNSEAVHIKGDGAMIGAVAGEDADVRNAQRITVRLESGKVITTVMPIDVNNPNQFKAGNPITLFITNGRVTEIR